MVRALRRVQPEVRILVNYTPTDRIDSWASIQMHVMRVQRCVWKRTGG